MLLNEYLLRWFIQFFFLGMRYGFLEGLYGIRFVFGLSLRGDRCTRLTLLLVLRSIFRRGVSLQISFVDAMNARNERLKVAACSDRVRLGHRRK